MRIAIVGAGGVGGYLGGRLVEAGEDVTFITRGAHLAAMQEHGLWVESIAGDVRLDTVKATDDPASVGAVDIVLITTKLWQLPDAARSITPILGARTIVIGLQNGVEAATILADILGPERVAGGTCALLSRIAAPGHIHHSGAEPRIVVGDLNGQRAAPCRQLVTALERAKGVTAVYSEDVQIPIWRKFLFIASISGVGALTRAPIGILRSVAPTRALLCSAMTEIEQLARARNLSLPHNAVEQALRFTDSLPQQATASMQRDVIAGRPSELEAQSGAVVRLAACSNIDVPVHQMIYAALLPHERRARGALSF